MFDQKQIVLVKANWQEIKPRSLQFASLFYFYLFDEHPELRLMFKESLFEQQQNFIKILDRILSGENEERAIQAIALGSRRYAQYGVQLQHYKMIEGALMRALEEAQEAPWPAELERAWRAFYKTIVYKLLS